MGSVVETLTLKARQPNSGLKARQGDYLIAGILLLLNEDSPMERKDLEGKSIKELTEIHNKLVARNDRKETFRTKDKAIEAVVAADKAKTSGATAAAKPAAAAKNGDVKKAAEKAAGEITKAAAKPADNTKYKVVPGQHRLNQGSVRFHIFNWMVANGKAVTQADIEKGLPKVKGIKQGISKLLEAAKIVAA